MDSLIFDKNSFRYFIKYDDALEIGCIHLESNSFWSGIFYDENEILKSLGQPLKPKMMFNLLKEYERGKLDHAYQFYFPHERIWNTKNDLLIQLAINLPHADVKDSKNIILTSQKIDNETMNELKLYNLKKELERIDKKCDEKDKNHFRSKKMLIWMIFLSIIFINVIYPVL